MRVSCCRGGGNLKLGESDDLGQRKGIGSSNQSLKQTKVGDRIQERSNNVERQ
jgi:hypothetical protein